MFCCLNRYTLLTLALVWSATSLGSAQAQSITSAKDETGTTISHNGDQYDITGGVLSEDGANLFHGFGQFGLTAAEVANFMADPAIQNILGRVTGGNASIIDGLLRVSGGDANLYLINPAGILFGPNARLDLTGSFTALTATGIGFNDTWLSAFGPNDYAALVGNPNRFAFAVDQPAAIFNAGDLAVSPSQMLTLVGGSVINTGTLTAPGGQITVASVPGQSQLRISHENMLLTLELETLAQSPSPLSPTFTPLDLPALLTAGADTHATDLIVNPDGTVRLTGSGLAIAPDSGTTVVSGGVDASCREVFCNASTGGVGGTIAVLGDRVGLVSATVDASGNLGGGSLLVGGGYQGEGPVPNASQTYVDSDSILNASALETGDGGRVVVWADQSTQFYGEILAQGGISAGNGGFVEVSGLQTLIFDGQVDTSALNGYVGTLLLDPLDITVSSEGFEQTTVMFEDFPEQDAFIAASAINNATTNVLFQATNDITFDVPVSISETGIGLTAQANNNIFVNADITTDGGDIVLNANWDGVEAGAIFVADADITSNGGDIILGGGSDPLNNPAVGSTEFDADGVSLLGAMLDSGAGDITLTGRGGNGVDGNGVELAGSTLRSTSGAINLNGIGGEGDPVEGSFNEGIVLLEGSLITSDSGAITLNGEGGAGMESDGIDLFSNEASIQSNSGAITLNGIGGNGEDSDGIDLVGSIRSDSGAIILNGEGGIGVESDGIDLTDQEITSNSGSINSKGGAITLTGISGIGGNSAGIVLNGGILSATNNAPITLTADEINVDGEISGNNTLTLEPFTPEFDVTIGGSLSDSRLNLDAADIGNLADGFSQIIIGRPDGLGEIVLVGDAAFLDPVTLQVGLGGFDLTNGTLIGSGNSPLTLIADQALTFSGGINTVNFSTSIISRNGSITIGDIATAGGPLTLTSANGSITTGDINTAGEIGGDVFLNAATAITTGEIDTRGTAGNAGNVILDPSGDVQVSFINAESVRGIGGSITVVAGRFFRATGRFLAQNETVASLSSIGSLGSGDITLTHGGGRLGEPFVVGDATTNGTAAAITSGEFTLDANVPNNPFRTSFNLGDTAPGNIDLITLDFPTIFDPCFGDCSSSRSPRISDDDSKDGRLSSVESSLTVLPKTEAAEAYQRFETRLTREFVDHLGLDETPESMTLPQAQDALRNVQSQTGENPALLFVVFGVSGREKTLAAATRSKAMDRATPEALSLTPRDSDPLELMLVTADADPVYVRIPEAARREVLTMAQRLRRQVTNPYRVGSTTYLVSAQTLYRWLIAPLTPVLEEQEITNIGFIMDSGLRSLPLAALHDGQGFLVESYSVGLIPSLALIDPAYVNLQNAQALVGGASEFIDQTPLPFEPIESETIQSLWPGRRLQNSAFTVDNLQAQRQQTPYGIIHLSTHGEFSPGALRNSYIQFFDNKLRLDQLRNLGWANSSVELISLSACQTALGNRKAELGFAGIAVLAGAKSALASLWKVSDEATTGLMVEFYQQLQTSPSQDSTVPIKAEALRQAQLAMIRGQVVVEADQLRWTGGSTQLPPTLSRDEPLSLSHPFHWAAFTLVGTP
ncbi:MAG: CHAT domain-containing protein, partial [Leptolyngbyaceae cyanobacterium MO_188.B28]|nr:CHAT domain-containing protein [Leptolyngbyaceae cyanobacterium MO_188.B28]